MSRRLGCRAAHRPTRGSPEMRRRSPSWYAGLATDVPAPGRNISISIVAGPDAANHSLIAKVTMAYGSSSSRSLLKLPIATTVPSNANVRCDNVSRLYVPAQLASPREASAPEGGNTDELDELVCGVRVVLGVADMPVTGVTTTVCVSDGCELVDAVSVVRFGLRTKAALAATATAPASDVYIAAVRVRRRRCTARSSIGEGVATPSTSSASSRSRARRLFSKLDISGDP